MCGPIALCAARRYIEHPVMNQEAGRASAGEIENTMHIEIERVVEEIKQSVGLLRRHL